MTSWILIVVLNVGAYYRPDNSFVTMQEFNSERQCQYAAELIRKSANNVKSLQCIHK